MAYSVLQSAVGLCFYASGLSSFLSSQVSCVFPSTSDCLFPIPQTCPDISQNFVLLTDSLLLEVQEWRQCFYFCTCLWFFFHCFGSYAFTDTSEYIDFLKKVKQICVCLSNTILKVHNQILQAHSQGESYWYQHPNYIALSTFIVRRDVEIYLS